MEQTIIVNISQQCKKQQNKESKSQINQLINDQQQLIRHSVQKSLNEKQQNIQTMYHANSKNHHIVPNKSNQLSTSHQNVHSSQILNEYFKPYHIKMQKNHSTAFKYSQLIHSIVQSQFYSGQLNIANKTHQIKNLLEQTKLSNQQTKLLEIKAQAEIRSKKIQLLDPFQQLTIQKIKIQQDFAQKQQLINMISNSVLSKQEHKKLIEKFTISNRKLNQNRKQRIFEIQERQRNLSYEKQQAEQEKRKKQKQLKRLSIQQKLNLRRQHHQKFLQQQKNSLEKYKQVSKKKLLHQNLQERYKSEVLIPILEEKKMKLKQLRDFYKKYDVSEIKKHEAQYLEKMSKSTQKNTSRTKINTFHYNPPEKSKRLSQLLQEQNYRAKIKFQEKKRTLEENKLKQLNFLSEINLKFKPKTDLNKKQEIQQRLKSSIVQKKHQLSDKDLKQLGMRYFEQARTKIKKNYEKRKTEGNDIQPTNDKNKKPLRKNKQKTQGNDRNIKSEQENEFIPVGQVKKINTHRDDKKINTSTSTNPNHRIKINESKRKEIKKIINSQNLDRGQKLQRLRLQNQKINEIYKRRQKFYRQNEDDEHTRQQAIGLLLNSIQTKMGIIDICALK